MKPSPGKDAATVIAKMAAEACPNAMHRILLKASSEETYTTQDFINLTQKNASYSGSGLGKKLPPPPAGNTPKEKWGSVLYALKILGDHDCLNETEKKSTEGNSYFTHVITPLGKAVLDAFQHRMSEATVDEPQPSNVAQSAPIAVKTARKGVVYTKSAGAYTQQFGTRPRLAVGAWKDEEFTKEEKVALIALCNAGNVSESLSQPLIEEFARSYVMQLYVPEDTSEHKNPLFAKNCVITKSYLNPLPCIDDTTDQTAKKMAAALEKLYRKILVSKQQVGGKDWYTITEDGRNHLKKHLHEYLQQTEPPGVFVETKETNEQVATEHARKKAENAENWLRIVLFNDDITKGRKEAGLSRGAAIRAAMEPHIHLNAPATAGEKPLKVLAKVADKKPYKRLHTLSKADLEAAYQRLAGLDQKWEPLPNRNSREWHIVHNTDDDTHLNGKLTQAGRNYVIQNLAETTFVEATKAEKVKNERTKSAPGEGAGM